MAITIITAYRIKPHQTLHAIKIGLKFIAKQFLRFLYFLLSANALHTWILNFLP